MKSMVVYYQDSETGVWRMGWGSGFPKAAPPGLLALINKIIYTIKTQKGSNPSYPYSGCQIESILRMAPGLDNTEISTLLANSIEDVASQIIASPITTDPAGRLRSLIIQSIIQDQEDKTIYRMKILVVTEAGTSSEIVI